ncbi:MAG: hypothetical protein MPW14_10915 [Candidatus Manganitrophus sp.]|nr:MAG: hypothetical protein MPW14_10915 [Candidatus Manganitrophus sp.]
MEEELEQLEELKLQDVLARAREAEQRDEVAVSSEALVYLLRREARKGNLQKPGVDGLISILVNRSEITLKHHISGVFDELQCEEICHEVIDRMIDEITDASDKADYAEVNFNDWLRHNRIDACRKQERKDAGTEQVGDAMADLAEDEADIMPIKKEPISSESPEAAYALTEARDRIAAAIREANLAPTSLKAFLLYYGWDVPIESKDPKEYTLVKHFGKSEKTIRNWLRSAEKVFAKQRGETNEGKREEAREPGLDTTRLLR